jgi:Coenzyme PQQ synthesis protein D (PqqD)
MLNLEAKWTAGKDLVARINKDGSVILMRLDESSNFYKIDGIAAQVWQSLSESKSVTDLINEQVEKLPQFANELKADIPPFVASLLEKKLIVQHS